MLDDINIDSLIMESFGKAEPASATEDKLETPTSANARFRRGR